MSVRIASNTRHPDVAFGDDGKIVVSGPDGVVSHINSYDVDGAANESYALWMQAESKLNQLDAGLKPFSSAGPTFATSNDQVPEINGNYSSSRRSGSSRYIRRAEEVGASSALTGDSLKSTGTLSNASSSLLRRLRLRRSKSSLPRRSNSDARAKDLMEKRQKQSNGGSARSADKPEPKRSRKDKKAGGRAAKSQPTWSSLSLDKYASGSSQQVKSPQNNENLPANKYWQRMIQESRAGAGQSIDRSTISNNSSGKRKRKRKKSPASSLGSSGGSSMQRTPRIKVTSASSSSNGSLRSVSNSGSRLSRDKPRMSAEWANSLERSTGHQTNSAVATSGERDAKSRRSDLFCRCRRGRCLDEPCAVGTSFVVLGCLLVAVGVTRMLVCLWHEFGSSIWTGVPLFLFGFMHIVFGRSYENRVKVAVYLILGAITSVAVLAATAISLVVLVGLLGSVIQTTSSGNDVNTAEIPLAVNLSKYSSDTAVTGVTSVIWPSVALDICSLVLLAASLHSQTVTVEAFDSYLTYAVTADSKTVHRSSARKPSRRRRGAFRAADQMTVGQVTIFVGLLEIMFMEYLPGHDRSAPHAWSMVWSGALAVFAGLASLFYEKFKESKPAIIVSAVMELCSLLGSAVTTVLTTLAIAKDAQLLQRHSQTQSASYVSNLAALVAAELAADVLSVSCVVFAVGILFRVFSRLCRCTCTDPEKSEAPDSPVANFSSLDRTGTVDERRNRTKKAKSKSQQRVTMSDWRPTHTTDLYTVGTGPT